MKLILRRADSSDAKAVADVWLRSYSVALPTVRRAHTDAEVRKWLRSAVVDAVVWVAEVEGRVVGMMALGDGWISQLYLDPRWRGHGIGERLVALAKREHPEGLQLWAFQVNEPARRFYRRHGFVEVELTDGENNEEREPDVRMTWSP